MDMRVFQMIRCGWRTCQTLRFLSARHFTSIKKMPTALIILAEGAEEMEMVITADVLRRGGVIGTCPLSS